jgi:aminopeptidase N
MVGSGPFRDGVSEYLDQHRFGNASWPDLIDVLARRTPGDLQAWSHVWVNERGRPIVSTELEVSGGRIVRLSLVSRDPAPDGRRIWPETLQVALGDDSGVHLVPVNLDRERVDVLEARGLPAPRFVLPNGGGIGYGEFHLDPRSRAWLVAQLPAIDDALTRGSAWVTLWDAMLAGDVKPDAIVALALKALPREGDELNTQRILGYLNQTFWRFTPASRRARIAPRVERALRRGLDQARTTTLKAAYFAALRDLALTRPTTVWLESVWREDTRIGGLPLAEPDYIALAEELAVRAVPGWKTILASQIERTRNPDRKARLEFVAPALSPDAATRDRLFASLHDVANRRREPWALEAMWYLNHPLRGARSVRYVAESLRLLPEIQRTGDIFFPKRWVDNALAGHRSQEAARAVQDVIDRLPEGYPDRLRRIILSAADGLFRASRLR